MSEKFEAKNSKGGAFFIDESTLRHFVSFIENAHAGAQPPATITIAAEFEETRTIETSNVNDVFEDPMARSK